MADGVEAAEKVGYTLPHLAVDGCSRLVYLAILDDERKETAAGFWHRTNAFFEEAGITVTAAMTNNGCCYRSREFAAALGTIRHKWAKPYRPHTNGNVERFDRTLTAELAYAAVYDTGQARAPTYDA